MAILDDELSADRAEDRKTVEYIYQHLDPALRDVYTPEIIQTVIESAVDYLAEEVDWDSTDDDGFMELSVDDMAQTVYANLQSGLPELQLKVDDLALVLGHWMDSEGWDE